ncbi:MAG TPA: MFS transporter [Anaerolineales bacterium]|nr:MFS transporter [Anaerolineales bacterium]
MRRSRGYRWFVVGVFFGFILLHQTDRLLISPLTTDIMQEFRITKTQMGMVTSAALLVGAVLFPVWGYLYDRFARPKLLALASFIWGSTTWLAAIAPTYPSFLAARASTGVDDSSYPGIYSLISDYFGPAIRGRVYALLQIGQPVGYLLGMGLALGLGPLIGWRSVFYITGSIGIVVALLIFFGVKDAPRGQSEPELEGLAAIKPHRFDWKTAAGLFRKRSLIFLYGQGFVGVIPWNVITFWFFAYLETERGYDETAVLMTMAPAVLVLSVGYYVGGALGDALFRRTRRGRLIISLVGVLAGAALLTLTLRVPHADRSQFMMLLLATAMFIPFASPNVISTVYDVSLPEVRSTALAVQYFIEDGGSALAPLLAGILADASSLENAILVICVTAWLIGAALLIGAAYLVPRDMATLRSQMKERALESVSTT